MLIGQLTNEIAILLKKADPKSDYEMIFTKMNSLIWNANSRGLLSQNEYNELTNHLAEFERELFRVKDC